MARENVGEEEMRRRFLLWQFRMLTAKKSGEISRLRRELDEVGSEWAAANKVTELLERKKIANDDAQTLFEKILRGDTKEVWAFLRRKGVLEDETA